MPKMSQTDYERMLNDARLKSQRDEAARLEYAYAEGYRQGLELARWEQGLEEGMLFGPIRLLEQLLDLPISSFADLQAAGKDQLRQREQEMLDRYRSRRNDSSDPIHS